MSDTQTSPAPSSLAQFSIHSEGFRHTLVVNGEDITDKVDGASVIFGPTSVARLQLVLAPSIDPKSITGNGIVQVPVDYGRAEHIVEFLANIDPGELEKAVMESTEMGDNPAVIMLAKLKEWAGGMG